MSVSSGGAWHGTTETMFFRYIGDLQENRFQLLLLFLMLTHFFSSPTKVAVHPVYRSLSKTAFPCLTCRSRRSVFVPLHLKSGYATAHTDPPQTDATDLAHTRNIGIIAHIDAVNIVFLNWPQFGSFLFFFFIFGNLCNVHS